MIHVVDNDECVYAVSDHGMSDLFSLSLAEALLMHIQTSIEYGIRQARGAKLWQVKSINSIIVQNCICAHSFIRFDPGWQLVEVFHLSFTPV